MNSFLQTVNSQDLELAKHFLELGEVVAIPTETVYGLAANAFDDSAIEKIFKTKNRPSHNPLIVHIGSYDQLDQIAESFSKELNTIIGAFWPGPLTVLCPKKVHVSSTITAGSNWVAVRMPKHPLTLELLKKLSFPIVAPSANISNRISPTEAAHVMKYFERQIPMVLDGGKCADGIESTIISFENNQIIIHRLGAISKEALEVFGIDVVLKKCQKITSPGNFSKHYAPSVPMYLTDRPDLMRDIFKNKKIGYLLFNHYEILCQQTYLYSLSNTKGDLQYAMRNLYSFMHQLEEDAVDLIIAELLPDFEEGSAINDRLKRASKRQFIFENNNLDFHEFTTINR
jgi:L-threonylcarbamoyladenylate synthase